MKLGGENKGGFEILVMCLLEWVTQLLCFAFKIRNLNKWTSVLNANALWTFLVSKAAISIIGYLIGRFFFIFSKKIFDDFSKWRVPNMQQNSEKSSHSICSNNLRKMKKTLHFLPLFKWPLLEPKYVHSAMQIVGTNSQNSFIKTGRELTKYLALGVFLHADLYNYLL